MSGWNAEVAGRGVHAGTGSRAFDAALPCVVLVHGAGLDHTVWALQSRYLAHHARAVLAVDLPGHGASAGPPLATVDEMADWLAGVLDAAGVARAALAGHSMGSLAALACAARHPERVSALALLGTAAPMPVAEPLLAAARDNIDAAIDMLTLWGHAPRARLGGSPAIGMWMLGTSARLLERARPGVLYTDLGACAAYLDGARAAERVRCPTLVIAGEHDVMTPVAGGARLADALPHGRLLTLPGCGHLMLAEQPEAITDALAANL